METVDKLIRMKQLQEMVGFKKSTIYKFMQEQRFPKPVQIGKRAVAWRLSDIQSWIKGRTWQKG